MSLESRIAQMRQEIGKESSVYPLISRTLRKDSEAVHTFFQKSLKARYEDSSADPIDEELIDVYELRLAGMPTLSLPNNLYFLSGFSYVVGHWYPLINAVTSIAPTLDNEQVLDQHMEHLFPKRRVTAQHLREALVVDPSGASWLEEMARAEFREENLELIGALKAITGVRKMYEALTTS